MSFPPLILASASPRRRFLLRLLGARFRVRVSGVPERRRRRESPRALALRLALAKAAAVARIHPGACVLGADTVVCVGSRVLGTPGDRREAALMLGLLSGRRHRVWTAVALLEPGRRPRRLAVCTRVSVAPLSAADRRAYLGSGEWKGKAGGYGIQGRFAAWVRRIDGSYTNVVGLPLEPVRRLLRRGRSRTRRRSPARQAPSGRQRRRGRRAAVTSSRRRTGVR